MQQSLPLEASDGPILDFIDASVEVGAFEYLWSQPGATFKTLADEVAKTPGARLSHFVQRAHAKELGQEIVSRLKRELKSNFGVRVYGEAEYPEKLRDIQHPLEVLYYQGHWELVHSPIVAVVGTRKPSEAAIARTKALVKGLVADGFTVASGLAEGIDTIAHETAIARGGNTIAVIGTPLNRYYPARNMALQHHIAKEYLLISQVPVKRYEAQKDVRKNRWFFPERNKTMSALSEATVIVEAGETSGTLVQARECLRQGRKLFILDSCFQRPDLTWPARYEVQGAIRVRSYEEIRQNLVPKASQNH
jgi:DNA processing protein